MLVEQDVLDPKPHADEVAFGGWAIDLHPYKGIDAVDEPPFTPTHGKTTYGIPLRCYFSRNIENLFFAGRNISATHVAFASTRVMATCAVGGEAIGWAMGQCVKQNTTPAKLVADLITGRLDRNPWADLPWKAVPGHFGQPWFLPLVGSYYKLLDRVQ